MSIEAKLKELDITLPPAGAPNANYVRYVRTGNLVFLSGHIARRDGAPWVGKLGVDMTTEQGKAAARLIAIDLMGTLQAAAGNLERVRRIVKLLGLVNSGPEYTEHHRVIDSASELLVQVLCENALHARSAFGVAQIPLGACVEIELIAEIE